MNNVTPEKKAGLLKTLAIAGLFGIIILIAWLSVQIVAIFPSAVTSLASLADTVYSYDPRAVTTVTLKPTDGPIITGNVFTIAWNEPQKKGVYAFTYECQEGLSVEVKTAESDFKSAECGSSYELGAVDSALIVVNSEKKPVVELLYKVSYFKTNSASSTVSESQSVTILNPRLAVSTTSTEEVVTTETGTSTEGVITVTNPSITPAEEVPEVVVVAPTSTEPIKPELPVKPVVTKPPVYEYEYTYVIPTSDPKGFTDLSISYIGIGRNNYNGTFINTGVLSKNVAGAIQFSVKNIGTKTSSDWYFTAKLPGGINYESAKQVALKPNERAVLTINFPAITNNKLQTFTISTKASGDNNIKNDEISWSAVVIE